MNLYETLAKEQRATKFLRSDEMAFFLDYNGVLSDFVSYENLRRSQTPFQVIRANIVIRAILNKRLIEKAFAEAKKNAYYLEEGKSEFIKEEVGKAMKDLPYCEIAGERIYVPILPKSLNRIYTSNPEKLDVRPYKGLTRFADMAGIDPFDMYGYELYDSYFAKLILIKKEKKSACFYDYDSSSIYFVNDQGRLDVKICLFDHYLHRPSANHIIERITPVVEAYYKDDRDAMMKELVDNKLISSRLIYKINYDRRLRSMKVDAEIEE